MQVAGTYKLEEKAEMRKDKKVDFPSSKTELSRRIFLQLGSAAALATGIGCNPQPSPEAAKTEPATPANSGATPATGEKIPDPVPGTRINEGYLGQIARYIYAWGWPMVNIHNRKIVMGKVPEPGYMGGIVPMAPPNKLSMLHDYVAPEERMVACPNQDVAYGFGLIDLSQEPAVVQGA